MGILNVTPDSFSDGGRHLDPEAAIEHGRRLRAEGADWVDVGGESTRPGATPVDPDDEATRITPVIEALAADGIPVSVDTRHAATAEAAIEAGASMLNDVSATLHDVAAAARVPWVCMHMKGDPRTMQDDPRYGDVVAEVETFLVARADIARNAGVPEVWIDPGIGFGKTAEHNLSLLRHLDRLVATGLPVLVGTSRKGFLGRLTGGAPVDDRVEASLATATWALAAGVKMVRVHDVAATVQAAAVVTAEVELT